MILEQTAWEQIDQMLVCCGRAVQDRDSGNLSAALGVAICGFSLKTGHCEADYLLRADGKAAGVVEAKPTGRTLWGKREISRNEAKTLFRAFDLDGIGEDEMWPSCHFILHEKPYASIAP